MLELIKSDAVRLALDVAIILLLIIDIVYVRMSSIAVTKMSEPLIAPEVKFAAPEVTPGEVDDLTDTLNSATLKRLVTVLSFFDSVNYRIDLKNGADGDYWINVIHGEALMFQTDSYQDIARAIDELYREYIA